MAQRDGMRRLELISLHLASGAGCSVRPLLTVNHEDRAVDEWTSRHQRSLAANRGGNCTRFFDRLAKGSDYLATGTRIADCSAEVSPIAPSRQTGVVQAAGQPPPSAMNSAAVSARRLASVCTRTTDAVR